MWLHTDVELTVAGKSREEVLGSFLPEGWKIASLSSPIPCAIDGNGLLRAQVRPGKWIISLSAFSTTPLTEMTYPEGVKPIVSEELISLQTKPRLRLIEFRDVEAIDVAQTTFPAKWRSFPLYLWENKRAFTIIEKMRGMGNKKPPGLSITRQFWLDQNGKKMTYQDLVQGNALQTWRLDAAKNQDLGAAKIGSESQLITKNPDSGALGVELRTRSLTLQSVGRMKNTRSISATGWQTDADELSGTLFLPPGWRAFAIWGADRSQGDWLSHWSLLDIFFLLAFTMAVFKLTGWKLSAIAFVSFVLSYHESGAPRFVWVAVLICLASCRYLTAQKLSNILRITSYAFMVLLFCLLVPFFYQQIQQALFPQLKKTRHGRH